MVTNSPKHEFWVQWGGSGAFVAKNSDATSWHKLLHYFGPFCAEFHTATKRSRMHPNSTKHTKMLVYDAMGGSDVFVVKNSDATSWHKLLHYFGPFCTEFRKATKRSRMHPSSTKRTKTSIYGAMGWIRCVRCEKFRSDFVARTLALVRPVLHRVSEGNQTVPNPNSTKRTKMSI